MWINLLKLFAVLFLNRKVSALRSNLRNISHHMADYTEDRAQQLKQDFLEETNRIATSLAGLLVVFSMFIFTGLLGLMWLFSVLWDSPHRSLILGLTMLCPALIGIVTFMAVRKAWKQKPLFSESIEMIGHDWQLFRKEMAAQSENNPQQNTSNGQTSTIPS